jgi:ubiquinone/menaquinone biosynthesis C-methylase UbiE
MSNDDDGRAYWGRHAKNYDRAMALLGGPIPRMADLAGVAVRGLPRVLEIGAGTGLVTPSLARSAREVVATDYSAEMVTLLEHRIREAQLKNVRCEQADLYALRFDPASFDAVVAANVLHLVVDLPAALAALRSVLKPGGCLVVPTYCHDETAMAWGISRVLALTGFPGRRRFTALSLRQSLEEAGLQITQAETLPGLLPIAYLAGTFGPPA